MIQSPTVHNAVTRAGRWLVLPPRSGSQEALSVGFDILLSPPDVGDLEQEYVVRAMRSGWAAPAGPDLDLFEGEVAARADRRHAVALASGTAALHLTLIAWGVSPGDVVPVSTLTFAATVNAIRYVGAEPWFVDSEEDSGNLDLELLDDTLTALRDRGASVPCVVPVDLLGRCVDHAALTELAARHGVRVLWDAAESFGSRCRGRPSGSAGDAAVVSFNGNKIMTTSGGGMLLTDDGVLAARARKLASQAREPVAHYQHVEVGYNYRLSNLLAALGRAQLARLEEMICCRRRVRAAYAEVVAGLPGVRVLGGTGDEEDNCWLTAVVVDPEVAGYDARRLGAAMAAAAIETRPIWKPMHLQPVFAGHPGTLLGRADRLFDRTLTLPSGSGLPEAQLARVCRVLGSLA